MTIKQLSILSCPPCQMMKREFADLDVEGFEYEYVDLHEPGERQRMIDEGTPIFKASVPQFYIDGEAFQGTTTEAYGLLKAKVNELRNESGENLII